MVSMCRVLGCRRAATAPGRLARHLGERPKTKCSQQKFRTLMSEAGARTAVSESTGNCGRGAFESARSELSD